MQRVPLRRRTQRVGELLRVLAVREFRTRYRQSALDVVWSFINPVVVMIVYAVILSGAFSVSGDGVPYLSFAWAGVVMWTFFSAGLAAALASLVSSGDLISKVYFPREALPLSAVAANVPDLGIGIVTVVILGLVQGVRPSVEIVAVVAPVLLVLVWTAALGVFGAAFTVFLRDTNHAVLLLLRVGFFAVPVMYPVSNLPRSLAWTASVDPVAVAIESFRDTVLRGRWPSWDLLGIQFVIGAALLVVSVLYVRSVEDRMVDVV